MRLWVDGDPVASVRRAGQLLAPGLPLWIGGNHPYGEHFAGVIDEVRVYSRALDRAELERDGLAPVADTATTSRDLAAAYDFDEGTGDTAADASGHGNVGTLLGATWTTDGRFGNALRFDGSSATVRVASSPALDLGSAMTLSAWVRPARQESGWRTVVQREVDTYFLVASSSAALPLDRFDDLLAGLVVAALAALVATSVRSRGAWLGARRRSTWLVGVALVVLGLVVDGVTAPTVTIFGALLPAVWLAATAEGAVERVVFASYAMIATGLMFAFSEPIERFGLRWDAADGSGARAAALGVLLVLLAVVRLRPRRGRTLASVAPT
jgi:hypothetical protein